MFSSVCLIFTVLTFPILIIGYKPVVMLHGFQGSHRDFDRMIEHIQKYHPGTETLALTFYEDFFSMESLIYQLPAFVKTLKELSYSSYHLVCHSQGALICRTALQMMNDPRIETFISLSGPQMGQFGVIDSFRNFFPNLTTDDAYLVLYTELVQKLFSAANYWNDPFHQTDYLTENIFLPILNNQTLNPLSEEYKKNFVSLNKLVLFGSPQDEVIQPWESALFGFWNDQKTEIIPMEKQLIYENDYIGLKTLQETGKLFQHSVPDVLHMDWLDNQTIFVKYIEPLLT